MFKVSAGCKGQPEEAVKVEFSGNRIEVCSDILRCLYYTYQSVKGQDEIMGKVLYEALTKDLKDLLDYGPKALKEKIAEEDGDEDGTEKLDEVLEEIDNILNFLSKLKKISKDNDEEE